MSSKQMKCPECRSTRLIRNGTKDAVPYWMCQNCGKQTSRPLGKPADPVEMATEAPKARRYIVTCAQNATPVHAPFWKALKVYAEHTGAELLVIPIRYKNPTSVWSQRQADDEWWASEVVPHLYAGRDALNPNLVVLGDIKTQLTAKCPTQGYDTISGPSSAILGHPKIEMKAVATPSRSYPKLLHTTGACTKPNYTDTRAGKVAEFHHSFGAIVVELDDRDRFHMRSINATRNGHFQDLRTLYTPKGAERGPPIAALVMGDTHVDVVDPRVVHATFTAGGSIVDYLEPQELIWHDLVDFATCSPHNAKDPFDRIAREGAERHRVVEEIQRAAAFVDEYAPETCRNVIVDANHHDFLRRWIIATDWKRDPANAEFYLETALAMVRSAKLDERGTDYADPFEAWFKRFCEHPNVVYPGSDGSHMVRNIETAMHGHRGVNGARGSIVSFAKMGVKNVYGHEHGPGIKEGSMCVGTSAYLRQRWNAGPSNWLHTHAAIYQSGKRSLLNIVGDSWRLADDAT